MRTNLVARLTLILGVISIITLGFVHVSLPDMRASDDNIWLYSVGRALAQGTTQSADAEERLTQRVRAAGAEDSSVLRYDMRLGYRNNYLLAVLVWGSVGATVDAASVQSFDDYAERVAVAIATAGATSQALAALALVFGLLLARRTDLAAAAFGGLSLLLVLTLVAPPGAAFLFWERHGWEAFTNALQFALHPDGQYTVFGFTPRSQMGLLTLLAFVLRWRGWMGASYAVLAVSGLVHQSMATLMFAIVLAMDLLLRPADLKQRGVWPFIVVGLLLIATRETLWSYVLAPKSLMRLGAVIIVIGLVAVLARLASRSGYFAWLQAARTRLAAFPLYAIDAIALGCGWVATLPLGYVLANAASPMQRLYFWDQVHSRSWLLIAPVVASATVLALLHRLEGSAIGRRCSAHPFVAGLVAVVLVVLPLVAAIKPVKVIAAETSRLQTQMRSVGQRLAVPLDHVPGMDDEAVLYLGLARELDTGEPMIERLIPLPVKAAP